MKTLITLVAAASLFAACKKDDKKADPPKGSAADTGSAAAGSAAAGSDMAAGSADPGSAAAGSADTGAVPELMAMPAGLPKDCNTAYDKMKKLHGCAKADMKTRVEMTKAWNDAVKGSFEMYGKAKADDKKTIEGTCTRMGSTFDMLIKDC